MRLTLFAACIILTSFAVCWTALADPPAPVATAPTIADVLKAREAVTAALKKEAEVTAAFNKELAKLGAKPVEPFLVGLGKPGKDGKDGAPGHSPVIKWGTGADFDRLSIDGVFSGPHLTGPKGDPGPAPVAPPDAFVAAVQAAYGLETAANRSQLITDLAGLYSAWPAQAFNDPAINTTDKLLANWLVARRSIVKDTELTHVRAVVDEQLKTLFGPVGVPFDAALKAKAVPVYSKISEALKAVTK